MLYLLIFVGKQVRMKQHTEEEAQIPESHSIQGSRLLPHLGGDQIPITLPVAFIFQGNAHISPTLTAHHRSFVQQKLSLGLKRF